MIPTKITPTVLAGGSGSRLWPLSNEATPKQFLRLTSDWSMLQQTLMRFDDTARFKAPMVVCSEKYRELVIEQSAEISCSLSDLLLEPMKRDSAAAIAAAALRAATLDADALLLICPSDHLIHDTSRFTKSVDDAAALAARGYIVTFGVAPTHPETGYGYIRCGAKLEASDGLLVDQFVEKPDAPTACGYLASGRHLWNSGMFMARADVLVEELSKLAPDLLAAIRSAINEGEPADDATPGLKLGSDAFKTAPSISFDYAVMEKSKRTAVVRAHFDWCDLGSWDALADVMAPDTAGNICQGAVATVDVQGSYCRSAGPEVAVIGLENVVVIATESGVLVASKNACQDVKKAVAALSRPKGATELEAEHAGRVNVQ